MPKNLRHKDANWTFPTTEDGSLEDWKYVPMALLMDIRDELKQLNRVFACHNFVSIPHKLDQLVKNTKKRRKKKTTK